MAKEFVRFGPGLDVLDPKLTEEERRVQEIFNDAQTRVKDFETLLDFIDSVEEEHRNKAIVMGCVKETEVSGRELTEKELLRECSFVLSVSGLRRDGMVTVKGNNIQLTAKGVEAAKTWKEETEEIKKKGDES